LSIIMHFARTAMRIPNNDFLIDSGRNPAKNASTDRAPELKEVRQSAMMTICTILLVLAVLYIIEVILGSSSSVHDAEIGLAPGPFVKERITSKEFFRKVVPLILLAIGLPLIFESIPLGISLLAASLLLFLWFLPPA
jgi:hypothetical protein